MIWFVVVLSILLVLSTFITIVSIKKSIRLADQRDELVIQIEESLDRLDTCYSRVSQSASNPLMNDDPVIREVVSSIIDAKHAILAIAGKVVTYGSDDDDDDDEEDEG